MSMDKYFLTHQRIIMPIQGQAGRWEETVHYIHIDDSVGGYPIRTMVTCAGWDLVYRLG